MFVQGLQFQVCEYMKEKYKAWHYINMMEQKSLYWHKRLIMISI